MNRTLFFVCLLVFCLALVAGWSVLANGSHPVSDNMCGAHSYGDCFNDGDWVRGWYDYLRHTKSELGENSTDPGWRTFSDTSSNGTPYTGISYSGQARVPEATEISPPQSTGSSSQTCHVQHVTVNSVNYQKCVSQTKFWCDMLNNNRGTAREYVQWIMPSNISC